MCNVFATGCGSPQTVRKPAPTCWEKCTFHEGRKIHSSKGGSFKNCWSTQTSPKSKKGKENVFSIVDVIFFAQSAYIGNVWIETHQHSSWCYFYGNICVFCNNFCTCSLCICPYSSRMSSTLTSTTCPIRSYKRL